MPILDHFDFLSHIYDRALPFKGLPDWLEYGNLPVEGSLLDVGGGTGRVAAALQPYVNHIVVVDASPGMLRQASEKQIDSLRCYSERLCFPDQAFDRVIMVDAFHHIIDGAVTISEMWRVLKPGGKIIIHEPDIRSPVVWIVAIVEKIALMRSHFVSPPAIVRMFSRYDGAEPAVYRNGYTAWITITKRQDSLF